MSQRDEIARIVDATRVTYLGRQFVGSPVQAEGYHYAIADALAAAGLLVPPAMTAEKLRDIATWFDVGDRVDLGDRSVIMSPSAAKKDRGDLLRSWASFLDTQETP